MQRIKIKQITILTVSDDTEIVDSPDGDGSKCLKNHRDFFLPIMFLMRSIGKVPPMGEVTWTQISEEDYNDLVLETDESEVVFTVESENDGASS